MAREQARIDIVAGDSASGPIGRIASSIRDLATGSGQAATQTASWTKLLSANILLGWASQVASSVQAMISWVNEGERLNKTAVALERQLYASGVAAGTFRAELKGATGGELAGAELDLLAKKVKDLGFAWEQIPGLMAAAKSAADIRGEGVEETTEKLARGMATGAREVLAQYDILIDKTTVLKNAAAAAGVPVEALTDAQQRNALIAATMAQLTGKTADAVSGLGSAAARATAQWTDGMDRIRASVGGGRPEWLDWLATPPQADQWAERTEEMLAQVRRLGEESARIINETSTGGYGRGLRDAMEQTQPIAQAQAELYRMIGQGLTELGANAEAAASKLRTMDVAQLAGRDDTDAYIATLRAQRDELEAGADMLDRVSIAFAPVTAKARDMSAALQEQLARLEWAQAAYRATPEMLAAWRQELVDLQVEGKAASEQARELESWIGIAEKATSGLDKMVASLSAMIPPAKELAAIREIMPAASPETMRATAAAMTQVSDAAAHLRQVMEDTTAAGYEKYDAMVDLRRAGILYVEQLRSAGVAAPVVEGVIRSLGAEIRTLTADLDSQAHAWRGIVDMQAVAAQAAGLVAKAWGAGRSIAEEAGKLVAKAEAFNRELRAPVGARRIEAEPEWPITDPRHPDYAATYLAALVATYEEEDALEEARRDREWDAQVAMQQAWEDYYDEVAAEHAAYVERVQDQWIVGIAAIQSGWSEGMSAMQRSLSVAGYEVSQWWSTTIDSIGAITTAGIELVANALGGISTDWSAAMAAGLAALVPLLSALTGNARVAAGVIGTIAVIAAAVMGLMGNWAGAAVLGGLGVALLAQAAVAKKKTPSLSTQPSISATAAGAAPTGGGSPVYIVQNFAGRPLISDTDMADWQANAMKAVVRTGTILPREVRYAS